VFCDSQSAGVNKTVNSAKSDIAVSNSETLPRFKQTPFWARLRESRLGKWTRSCRKVQHELRSWVNPVRMNSPSVSELTRALALLDERASSGEGGASDDESPIFLLSTGWRAGSTLLQRILLTEPRLLLWGEPLAEMTLVSRLTEMVSYFISDTNLAEWRKQAPLSSLSLSTAWIANLYPTADNFRLGMRSMFDRWLGEPARLHGFERWGLKEVRIGASEAILLHWLYPNAKFLVISRHPYQCYRSLADAGWRTIYYRYPDLPIDSAARFAAHWNRIALSWAELPESFPLKMIRYEEILGGKVNFRELEEWLGIKIDETSALGAEVGGTAKRAKLSWYERLIIRREAVQGMQALGYSK
jgi:hypothetical protein